VPFAKKGRFGVVSGSVEEYFSPFHLQVETSTIDDLAESVLMQKVSYFSNARIIKSVSYTKRYKICRLVPRFVT
jgi:hypothetical protein